MVVSADKAVSLYRLSYGFWKAPCLMSMLAEVRRGMEKGMVNHISMICYLTLYLTLITGCSSVDGIKERESTSLSPDAYVEVLQPSSTKTTVCVAFPAGCSVPMTSEPQISHPTFVVPGDGLPADVDVDIANNNLDITFWRERFWLAWRTGPYHFADESVRMYVVSSPDLESWRFEGEVALGADVREPQLVALNDELLFYHAELGTNALAFEPKGTWLRRYVAPGEWTPPVAVFDASFIPWRIRPVDGVLQVLGYTGGENIYARDGDPIEVHWLTSSDGVNWNPVVDDQPVVLSGGSSETDAVVLSDGSLVGVSRNEAGDTDGFGMKICRADAESLGDWHCVADKKKYDSPLLFEYDDRVFLIGRRNVTESGHYDLEQLDLPFEQQYAVNQLDYSNKPKRCALWSVEQDTLKVSFILDLPSAGDTCFPELITLGEGRFVVFNYTSPLGQEADPTWVTGQFEPTLIYHAILTIPRR